MATQAPPVPVQPAPQPQPAPQGVVQPGAVPQSGGPVQPNVAAAQPAAAQPAAAENNSEGTSRRGFGSKKVWEGKKHQDGSPLPIDYFPTDEARCAQDGIAVFDSKVHRTPSRKWFTTEAILLEHQAAVYQERAKGLLSQAKDLRENPEKSAGMRKMQNYLDQFLALRATMQAAGVDTGVLEAKIQEAMGAAGGTAGGGGNAAPAQ